MKVSPKISDGVKAPAESVSVWPEELEREVVALFARMQEAASNAAIEKLLSAAPEGTAEVAVLRHLRRGETA